MQYTDEQVSGWLAMGTAIGYRRCLTAEQAEHDVWGSNLTADNQ